MKTMMFKATVNPGRNDRFGAMRYDPEFLKECLRITQQIPVIRINQQPNPLNVFAK